MNANNSYTNSTKTDDQILSELAFSEAPASWNTRYLDPNGFECQFTLRGESGQEVLEKADAAIAFLLSNDCSPVGNHYTNSSKTSANVPENGNGNNHAAPSNGGNHASWCPIHNVEMKRWEKDGRVWFSHKAGDEWCSGMPKRK